MASDDDPQQDATAASSPTSDANNQNDQDTASKALSKDRECVFCHQAFTSSSLGRHYDLYIKPKNPKPADGVHNVDEIRKIRGGITRRQPRNSLKNASSRREESAETLDHTNRGGRQAYNADRTKDNTPAGSPVMPRASSGRGSFVNMPSWQSTGVINNIPPRAPSRTNTDATATGQAQRLQDMRRDTGSGQQTQRPEPETDSAWKVQEQIETGRAAEMALREVLGSLKAARRKVEPGPIYEDFDFFAQTFPGLCLNILPPPTTLYSPAPFASAESWSLKPPGLQQSEVMNRLFNERCREMRKVNPEQPPDAVFFKHSAHLQGAFENWRLMSDKDKQAAWTLEALRCFTTSRDTNNKLKRRLADAEQHTAHLEAQYDRLARCQLPREWLVRPPKTASISESIAREMQKHPGGGVQESDYDADAILARWRETVRAVTRPSRHPTSHLPNYAASAMNPTLGPGETTIGDSFVMNGSITNIGGPVPREFNNNHKRGQQLAFNTAPETVSYETPPNPGAILDDTDDIHTRTNSPHSYNYPYPPPAAHDDDDEDGELAEDVSNVLDTSLTNFVDRNALAKQKRFVQGSFNPSAPSPGSGGTFGKFRINGQGSGKNSPVINSNGKRPAPTADLGYGGGGGKGQRT